MKTRFLLDENMSPKLAAAVKRANAQIDIVRVGDRETPSLGTDDPAILRFLAANQRILITANRNSIPDHLADFYAAGEGSHWGILWVRPGASTGELVESLNLIWQASDASEWMDRTDWIPL